jgi:hypothetical protein
MLMLSQARKKARINARHEKVLNNQHPAVGPGFAGALGSLRKGGEEEQGGSEGLLKRYMLAWGRG